MAICVSQKNMPFGESLFDAEIFEREVLHRLTEEYSAEKVTWSSVWKAPVNWKVGNIPNVPSVTFDVIPMRGVNAVSHQVVFPIRNDCLLTLRFSQHQLMSGNLEQRDAMIDRSSMIELSELIISSLVLQLSASTQSLLEAEGSNASGISPNVKPLKWTTEEEDLKYQDYLKRSGS